MKKISKAKARYQNAPKGTKRCRGCSMFITPNSCTLVNGDISAHGYCIYWESREEK